jgi:hypothetical protein
VKTFTTTRFLATEKQKMEVCKSRKAGDKLRKIKRDMKGNIFSITIICNCIPKPDKEKSLA